jgi:glycosyltransferase involved in cell wall biosynthesis
MMTEFEQVQPNSSQTKQPLVSILLLAWNHERFIDQCIESLRRQTYKNLEVIFLDNASSDKTYDKSVACLQASGLNFKSFQNTTGKTISKNLNFTLGQSSGEYIMPLSADDWFHEECVAKKIKFYEEHPHLGMVYSSGWVYYDDQQKLVEANMKEFQRGRIIKELFTEANKLFFIGICYKRSVLEKLGGWNEAMIIEDMDMFVRIALEYDIDYVPEPLAYYRKFIGSAATNIDFMMKGWLQYYEKYKDIKFVNMKAWISEKFRLYAALALDRSDLNKAKSLLFKAFSYQWTNWSIYRTYLFYLRKFFRTRLAEANNSDK